VNCPQELFDALVELHLAVQGTMLSALVSGAEPTEAAYERMANAFAASSAMLQKHTQVAPVVAEAKEAPRG